MRIAMLLSNPFRPDVRVLKEARSLASEGHDVSILAWDRKAEYIAREIHSDGFMVIRIQQVYSEYGVGKRQLGRLPRFWSAALRSLRQIHPQVIHAHDFDTLPAALFFGRLNKIPVIYDAHEYYASMIQPRLNGFAGSTLYELIRLAEIWSAKRASSVVTVDENLADIYRKLNSSVLVIGHYPSRQLASTPSSAFQHMPIKLVYSGRLSFDRGLKQYLEITRSLNQAGIPVRLALAGEFSPPAEKFSFNLSMSGIESIVDYSGWIQFTDLDRYLRLADVGLCLLQPIPRYQVALPVKLFEYMAVGLPVIGSNFPPIKNIVDEAQCGETFDPTDVSQAVQIILNWSQNSLKARHLGESGRNAIIERYNWERIIQPLLDLYQSFESV